MHKQIKKRIFLVAIASILIGLFMLSGCKMIIYGDDFTKYDVGDRVTDNRDGYSIKLNDSFFALFLYKTPDYIRIYKKFEYNTSDFDGDSELYYSDKISKCYCNNDNILVYSLTSNNYVLIDCNQKNNLRIIDDLNSADIDLSDFTAVIISNEES